MGVGGQHHAPAAFTPWKDPVPIAQEAGWASESVWIGAKNLASTGIRSPDFPARSESLYRLRYLGSGRFNNIGNCLCGGEKYSNICNCLLELDI